MTILATGSNDGGMMAPARQGALSNLDQISRCFGPSLRAHWQWNLGVLRWSDRLMPRLADPELHAFQFIERSNNPLPHIEALNIALVH
jgi:hypothetical protein